MRSFLGTECPYGDDNLVRVNNEKQTCQDVFNKFGKANMCEDSYVGKRCCKSCQKLAGAPADCLYGDDPIVRVNGVPMSCEDGIGMYGQANLCGNTNLARACCKACAAESPAPVCEDDPVVTINGEKQTCEQARATFGLYGLCDDWGMKHCCGTCKAPGGYPSNCRYGDERTIFVNHGPHTCNEAASNYGKAWLCSTPLAKSFDKNNRLFGVEL
ncbi:hypothetical protein ElyMa_005765400 [Elysia marginata]|uniref:ADAMTS cysteine-rich domain-containing protein n=1 Tax=Elysia marginata TaxID=1093978 RepID=A0AAV4FNP8_9GAST|nr:hypothetical protein ElyMa_005765400 [Elysia marginata]